MKTFDERRECVEQYMTKMERRRHRIVAMVTSLVLVVVLTVAMFLPIGTWIHGGDQSSIDLSSKPVTYSYRELAQIMEDYFFAGPSLSGGEMTTDATAGASPDYFVAPESGGQYEEVTDNQVAGVTEADIFKRSSEHIFYLRNNVLSVYSIAGENSALVGSFGIDTSVRYGDDTISHYDSYDMYLSSDCRTVTVMLNARNRTKNVRYTAVLSLDVSDPSNIQEINRVYITGSYLSSRMVDGKLLMMTQYSVRRNGIDAGDPATFVPMYGTPDNMACLPAECIVCPEELNSCTYTVICQMDAVSLQTQSTVACLGYSDDIYVSQDMIFVARAFWQVQEDAQELSFVETAMTEIAGISYSAEGLEAVATVTLEGLVKDQYSMDAHNGILRVVTSTAEFVDSGYDAMGFFGGIETVRNVNLYCVDLSDWSIAASVIAFAPEGEDAQSVRFDGDAAYVCTAEVITLTDPVYFFDLSDLEHITWTDTGTIDGYSSSLVQLGDGYLLGIGFSDARTLKLEVYEQTEDSVVSVRTHERSCLFSDDYKSYLIDREKDLVGLAVLDLESAETWYLLLAFDGNQLLVVAEIPCQDPGCTYYRACIIEDYLYILNGELTVQKIG